MSRMDEEVRGMKEMDAEGAGRYDGRNFFPSLECKKFFVPRRWLEREREREIERER